MGCETWMREEKELTWVRSEGTGDCIKPILELYTVYSVMINNV